MSSWKKSTWPAHHNLILFALNSNKISWSSRKLKLVRTADQLQPNPNWVTVLMPLVPTAPDLATRYDLVTPRRSCWPSQRGGKATWNPSAVVWTNSNKTAAQQLDRTAMHEDRRTNDSRSSDDWRTSLQINNEQNCTSLQLRCKDFWMQIINASTINYNVHIKVLCVCVCKVTMAAPSTGDLQGVPSKIYFYLSEPKSYSKACRADTIS